MTASALPAWSHKLQTNQGQDVDFGLLLTAEQWATAASGPSAWSHNLQTNQGQDVDLGLLLPAEELAVTASGPPAWSHNVQTNQVQGHHAATNPVLDFTYSSNFQPQSGTNISPVITDSISPPADHVGDEYKGKNHSSCNSTSKTTRSRAREIPQNCPTCHKSFFRRHDLNKHIKTHNRSISCKFLTCTSKFYRIRDAKRHELSCGENTDVVRRRDFKCTFEGCGYAVKGFAREDNCKRHIRMVHGGFDDHEPGSAGRN